MSYGNRSTTPGFSFGKPSPVYGYDNGLPKSYSKPTPKLSYHIDDETLERRYRELPGDDAYYLRTFGFDKRHYLAYLLAEEFTLQLYTATEAESEQEPFDCNALLLQEI